MAAHTLDVDEILRAQSSDDEQEETPDDAEAFDRRLEEILNAEEDEEEEEEKGTGDIDELGGWQRESDRSESCFRLHPSDDEGLSKGIGSERVFPVISSKEDESTVSEGSSNGEALGNIRLQSYENDETSSHITMHASISLTASSKHSNSAFNKELKPHGDSYFSDPLADAHLLPYPLEGSSNALTSSSVESPANLSRESSSFSQEVSKLPSVATLDSRTSITTRGDPAASSETEYFSPNEGMRLLDHSDLGQDENCTGDDESMVPLTEIDLHVGESSGRTSGSVGRVQSPRLLGKVKKDEIAQSSSSELKSITSDEEVMKTIHQGDSISSDDDSFLFDNDVALHMKNSIIGNSATMTSDDDSEQEEIRSILSRETVASDVKSSTNFARNASDSSPRVIASKDKIEPESSLLDKAEEAEKKAASSGLGIEAGATSQPMKLMGIQSGPLNIGYACLLLVNSVTQILSLASTTREHGTAQAISMHGNQLAVGLSKGDVFLLSLKSSSGKFEDSVEKALNLGTVDKSHAPVTSISFNMQGDLLLVGHANGFLALWELSSKGGFARPVNVEHTAAILHVSFLCTKHQKAISADCKGLVLLHSVSWSTFGRYSITTQCLVDGQNTGMVLCLSPLLLDFGTVNAGHYNNVLQPSTTAAASTALSNMVGGMVRGVVAGKTNDHAKRSMHDGQIADEAGNMVVFVTHQSIIVFRMPPMLEKCAMLPRPDGIRDGAVPYIAWRKLQMKPGLNTQSSDHSRNQSFQAEPTADMNKHLDEEDEARNLLLALGWDKKLFILSLSKGKMKIMTSWDMDSVICGVTWLDDQIMAIVTLKGQFYLFTNEGLEVQHVTMESEERIRNLELLYHTHMLNTFGNPEKTYYNSLTAHGSMLYLLGPQRIYRAELLPWQARLKALQDAGDFLGALRAGMELFDGRALAVMGLPKRVDELRELVTPSLVNLLLDYIDQVFTYLEAQVQDKEQYAHVGGVAIEFCVHIHQTDVLFNHIYHKFCAAGQKGTFLELLEPYILRDMLGALAPEVMQGLVEYYSQMGWVQRVELCVLHMDIASLDFNQVVRLCRENGLYSALIYLFNKGLDDYKSPLEELLIVVQDITNPQVHAFGYKLLIYLKYCFQGFSFPPGQGEISATRLPGLRTELLQCLLDAKPLLVSQTDAKELDFQSIIHPRLTCLLAFDLKATLKVLKCAFPESGPLGIQNVHGNGCFLKTNSESSESVCEAKSGLKLLQEVVDALVDILERIHLYTMNGGSKSRVELDAWRLCMSKIDAGEIMEFIADFVALQWVRVPRVVLARILEYLASKDRKSKLSDARRRETILVKLLNGVPESEWDSAHILDLALHAQFWQASACLLAKKGDLVAALDSYMKDKGQPYNGFLFVLDVLSPEKQLDKDKIREFRSSVLARLPELLQLSSEATLVIMLKFFSKEHRTILLDLAPYPPLLFQYLKQIMNTRLGYKSGVQSVKTANMETFEANELKDHDIQNEISDFCIGNESLSDLLKNAGLEFSNEMEELYVELLCKFEPKSVLKFLKSFEDYRLEHCLKLCQDHGIDDAAAYLLERVGDISSALSLVLLNIDNHIHDMDLSIARMYVKQSDVNSEVVDGAEEFLSIPEVTTTCSIMQAATELCQRNTWRMSPGESEALWFCLLDRFVDPLRKLHDARKHFRRRRASRSVGSVSTGKESGKGTYTWKVVMVSHKGVELLQRVLVYLIGEIVNGMMGYIPLSVIMDKLLSNNGRHEFGDFKGTILQMLGLYGYEQTILLTAKQVVEDDMFHKLSIYKRRATRGFAPSSSTCCICNRKLNMSESPDNGRLGPNLTGKESVAARYMQPTPVMNLVIVFPCRHAGHSSCIVPDINITKSIPDGVICPHCSPKVSLTKISHGKRTLKFS
ncbi:hypothetical protein KP509_08G032600 [Ceratopteris richardii]|uniref:Vacuolar protein sorting-associated protein 8 central domain-containing protein n=1 Tax=Ceratopteris richardii TaxID=49495 RepID=A0A8T2UFC5_CERRI|nr:hypothetical protein KP509_08G032600 [Ceratopteris richardii]